MLPTHPLSPFVFLPRQGPAARPRPQGGLPTLALQKGSLPRQSRERSAGPREFRALFPGDPPSCPTASSGMEACCFSSRTSPSSWSPVANLLRFGAWKLKSLPAPPGSGLVEARVCWVIPAGLRRCGLTGARLWIHTPAAGFPGTQSSFPIRALR